MFNYIRGKLAATGNDYVVIDNHGIGYYLSVPVSVPSTLQIQEKEVTLYTYMAVREDDISLYGFLTEQDLKLFKMLISVSGIGPKAALGVLSTLTPSEFYIAVMHENVKALTRVPGIGPKSAKRLLIELKEKVASLSGKVNTISMPVASAAQDTYQDALEALLALGYNGLEAQSAIAAIENSEEKSTEDLIRKALVHLSAR